MVDELFDRGYQAARADLNGGIATAFSAAARAIRQSFEVLHRIEWSAPWASEKTARRA